jgi:hypothetical protein
MRRLLIAGLAVLLAGCGGEVDSWAPGMPTPTAPPTVIGLPLATTVPASLTDIDLAPMLAAEGDLPAGYTLEKPTTQLQSIYGQLGIALPDATLTQLFNNPDDMSGFAAISLYRDQPMLSDGYIRLVQNMGAAGTSIAGLGEQATQSAVPGGKQPQASVVFVQCQAIVMIQGYGATTADPDLLVDWARKIAQRIQASPICQS